MRTHLPANDRIQKKARHQARMPNVWLNLYVSIKAAGNYTLISTSTPEGRSSFMRASMVFVVEE
jgi:hypothetical protein